MSHPLPPAFEARMRAQLGVEYEAYRAALELPYTRGLRLNPRKPLAPDALATLHGVGEPIPWYAAGRFLSVESDAGADPLHEAGAYYLQEPSAMAPAAVLSPAPGERVLDLCAAPGGKSTQLADALAGRGLLVCNEPVPSRARVLSRNLERMGVAGALVVSEEPARLSALWPQAFDAVLVDAPCSGEGMFRRHPETRDEWTERSPAGCAARQQYILEHAVRMLRPGGRLVYSTCTFNHEENEDVIAGALAVHADLRLAGFCLPLGGGKALDAPEGMLHLYPHQVRGEGHFVALLTRGGEPDGATDALFAPAGERLGPPDKAMLTAYGAFARELGAALPEGNARMGDTLVCAPPLPPLKGVRVLRAGVQLGALKGRVFAPDHALAMALPVPCELPTLPLTRGEALRYQRGETLDAPDSLRGYALATYGGLPLGFGKASGGQLKNHYPKGLRRG